MEKEDIVNAINYSKTHANDIIMCCVGNNEIPPEKEIETNPENWTGANWMWFVSNIDPLEYIS